MHLPRDEREREIDLRADRVGYVTVTYGLLLLVAVRAIVWNQASWDLMGLVLLGGAASLAYTAWRRATSRQMLGLMLSVAAGSAVAAVVIVVATRAA